MDIKRILTSVIGLPLVVLILIFGNEYIMDVLLTIIAIICMKEYYGVIEKVAHPVKWLGYVSTLIITLVSILSPQITMTVVTFSIPIILLILFSKVIITNMETTFKDVAYTFLGIFYITFFIMFLSLIRGLEHGVIVLGYTMIIAWATDIFAYLIGKRWGKHKFSKVSPKKSIEGCIAGIIGAVVISLIYVYIINESTRVNMLNLVDNTVPQLENINMLIIAIISIVLSIICQIGDFTASSIKRFADTKDYGNLLPGHGGMLDRVDSLIFIAPFVYGIVYIIESYYLPII